MVSSSLSSTLVNSTDGAICFGLRNPKKEGLDSFDILLDAVLDMEDDEVNVVSSSNIVGRMN